jgi:hypothetical protein
LGTISQGSNSYVSYAAPARRSLRPGDVHIRHIRLFRRLLNVGCCTLVVLFVGSISLPGRRCFLSSGSLWLFDYLFLGGDYRVLLWSLGFFRS